MAWTVPSGCYYANYTSSNVWQYWGAGQSVPDANAPINISVTSVSPSWLLVDFTNGYIYGTTSRATINITSSNTFTITDSGGWWSNMVRVFASDSALAAYTNYTITLTGTAFVFGDGSGLKDKFFHSSWKYSFFRAFANRTDIVSVTIPNGVDELIQAFQYCTNLQTATGTVANKSNCESAFRGCTSLVTVPTFQNVGSMASCFYGCTSLVTAPTIPEGVTNIANCFNRCSSLTTVPALPSTITAMQGAFMYCTALTTAPTIPSAVTNMQQCFNGCTSLVTASTIPANVTNTKWCFYDCAVLTGAITIDASPTDITEMFTGTVKEIVLFGTGGLNETLVSEYANLYVWSLTANITAQRETSPTTTVDISVDVSRFNSGTLSSLNLYRDSNPTPLSVTWNDPTLTITGTSATFTTTLTSISESDTFTLTVVATDSYGSSQASSVKIPISFYTMDVQAGGKEIAFGGLADDNVSSYPGGLFKCEMTAQFNGNITAVGDTTFTTGDTEIENPYFSLDTTASPGTTDGDLYAAIVALGWENDVIE